MTDKAKEYKKEVIKTKKKLQIDYNKLLEGNKI